MISRTTDTRATPAAEAEHRASKYCQSWETIRETGGDRTLKVQCDRFKEHVGPHQAYQHTLSGFVTVIWAPTRGMVEERAVIDG